MSHVEDMVDLAGNREVDASRDELGTWETAFRVRRQHNSSCGKPCGKLQSRGAHPRETKGEGISAAQKRWVTFEGERVAPEFITRATGLMDLKRDRTEGSERRLENSSRQAER